MVRLSSGEVISLVTLFCTNKYFDDFWGSQSLSDSSSSPIGYDWMLFWVYIFVLMGQLWSMRIAWKTAECTYGDLVSQRQDGFHLPFLTITSLKAVDGTTPWEPVLRGNCQVAWPGSCGVGRSRRIPGNRRDCRSGFCLGHGHPKAMQQGLMRVTFRKSSFFVCLFCFFFRERDIMSGGGAEKEGDTESRAGSRPSAVSTEPEAGLELLDRKIMTWAEALRLTDGATRSPPFRNSVWNLGIGGMLESHGANCSLWQHP